MIKCVITEIRAGVRQDDPPFYSTHKNALRTFLDCTLKMGYDVVAMSPTVIHFRRRWTGGKNSWITEEVWSGPQSRMVLLCEVVRQYEIKRAAKQPKLKLAA